ncbi:hypothetical protein [Vibrio vulnificus]|uniref:hypothetical protein n=1 Tax=Vibrio vulnificus TaxID=672 RepID=UPI001023E049|nr:hypothetical protein [Vibrio vulnificus]EHZ2651920.1 hypothetical protein [Vibrio vulnificus]MCU8194286.1 hypothetical protein [Vibrio vulnificus]RZQ33225.1 hypothetical protein D8T38_18455 [Vibrio vulnificus]HAS6231046.1 hypothetical protein [Vibrio vulnificus]HDY7776802.1 hypothetical protein [Vibrio vulnificus]
MQRRPFRIDNQDYSLTHLEPFSWLYVIPAQNGKPEQRYVIRVTFSCHCFTSGREQHHPTHLHYEEDGDLRTFCVVRHEHSKQLKAHIQALHVGKVFINRHKGSHQNYMRVPVGTQNYEIYFKLTRSKLDGVDLNLYVQSAFLRTHGAAGKMGKIKFMVAVHNTYHNKPIKAAPR